MFTTDGHLRPNSRLLHNQIINDLEVTHFYQVKHQISINIGNSILRKGIVKYLSSSYWILILMHSKSGYKTELRNPVVTTPKQHLINKNIPYLQHYQ